MSSPIYAIFLTPNEPKTFIHFPEKDNKKRKMIHEHPFIHTPHYTPYVLGIFW